MPVIESLLVKQINCREGFVSNHPSKMRKKTSFFPRVAHYGFALALDAFGP